MRFYVVTLTFGLRWLTIWLYHLLWFPTVTLDWIVHFILDTFIIIT